MDDIKPLTIDWRRSLLIDAPIDDELVRKLTPQILNLRQQNNDPITIGIDSPGGSLAALDILIELLTGPNQDKQKTPIITVATNRAYSAAANFLAFGNYAVALGHSQILCHDVRYGGMEDITPEKARDAAKSLQDANDIFALRLAHRIISRLVWIYIDLANDFENIKSTFPDIHKRYTSIVATYAPRLDGYQGIDLASFATSLWARVTPQNDTLIQNVMERLAKWISFTMISKSAPTYRPKGSRVYGLLDGSRHLHKLLKGRPEHFESSEDGLKLLLSLIVADLANTRTDRVNFSIVLERATREYAIFDSMNDQKHIRYASKLMLQHSHIFFNEVDEEAIKSKSEEENSAILNKAAPHARLLWHFCVLLCRELFEGEHILKPNDAQLLGLVDEVSGGGPIQSRRDYRIERAKSAEEKSENT